MQNKKLLARCWPERPIPSSLKVRVGQVIESIRAQLTRRRIFVVWVVCFEQRRLANLSVLSEEDPPYATTTNQVLDTDESTGRANQAVNAPQMRPRLGWCEPRDQSGGRIDARQAKQVSDNEVSSVGIHGKAIGSQKGLGRNHLFEGRLSWG